LGFNLFRIAPNQVRIFLCEDQQPISKRKRYHRNGHGHIHGNANRHVHGHANRNANLHGHTEAHSNRDEDRNTYYNPNADPDVYRNPYGHAYNNQDRDANTGADTNSTISSRHVEFRMVIHGQKIQVFG
jgi:hypothetical protein